MTLLWSQCSPGAGGGLPIVFLHAFPFDSRMWTPLRAQLANYPSIVVDLPGMGHSPAGEDIERHYRATEPDLALAAHAVADTLAELGHTRVILAGLSMGGYVAMSLLRHHRDLVAALALMDTKPQADSPQARQRRRAVAEQVLATNSTEPVMAMAADLLGASTRAQHPELIELQREWISHARPSGIAWSQRAMASRLDSTDLLATWRGPGEVVVGVEDEVTPVELAQAMADLMPNAHLTMVPKVGHVSAVENPAAVAEPLRRLYRALEG